MGMSNETAVKTAQKLTEFPASLSIKLERVGAKQAWISNCLKNRFFLIKSCNTIVGIVDDQEADFFEIGKYSRTTSKQVTQIYNSRFNDCERHYVEGRV